MLLRMKKTVRGAADGITVVQYVEGQSYELGGSMRADELAQVFMKQGWAEVVGAEAPKAKASPPPPPPPPPSVVVADEPPAEAAAEEPATAEPEPAEAASEAEPMKSEAPTPPARGKRRGR